MAAFTVVYIQLTALQVGVKYQKRGLIVMSESLEELKAIIDNAPDGATHFGIDCVYYQYEKADTIAIWREYTNLKSTFVLSQCICMMGLRSLSDIKRIIELMELNQDMHITVAGYLFGDDWTHWNELNKGKSEL